MAFIDAAESIGENDYRLVGCFALWHINQFMSFNTELNFKKFSLVKV